MRSRQRRESGLLQGNSSTAAANTFSRRSFVQEPKAVDEKAIVSSHEEALSLRAMCHLSVFLSASLSLSLSVSLCLCIVCRDHCMVTIACFLLWQDDVFCDDVFAAE